MGIDTALCMIVRDEEQLLPRCLESVRGHVQEIIVVDTGSRDRTVTIARNAGAKVIEIPWTDDFSAARNVGIEAARSDWILFLDADEVLTNAAARQLERVRTQPTILGVWIPIANLLDSGERVSTYQLRAFRRRSDVRFRYRVHEQVLPDLNRILERERFELAQIDGVIEHDGYLTARVEARDKFRRNARLLELQVSEHGDDAYALYMLADTERRAGCAPEIVISRLERLHQLLERTDPHRRRAYVFGGDACALRARLLLELGRADEAESVLRFAAMSCAPSPNLSYAQGRVALARGKSALAASAFRACLREAGRPHYVPVHGAITGYLAREGLVRALLGLGRTDEARETAHRLLAEAPDGSSAILTWADLEATRGTVQGVLAGLAQRVRAHPRCWVAWLRAGEILMGLRLFEKALPWLERAARLAPEPGLARAGIGQSLLALGRREEALEAFRAGLPEPHCRAGSVLLSLAYELEPTEAVADPNDEALVNACARVLRNLRRIEERGVVSQLDARQRSAGSLTAAFLARVAAVPEFAPTPFRPTSAPAKPAPPRRSDRSRTTTA